MQTKKHTEVPEARKAPPCPPARRPKKGVRLVTISTLTRKWSIYSLRLRESGSCCFISFGRLPCPSYKQIKERLRQNSPYDSKERCNAIPSSTQRSGRGFGSQQLPPLGFVAPPIWAVVLPCLRVGGHIYSSDISFFSLPSNDNYHVTAEKDIYTFWPKDTRTRPPVYPFTHAPTQQSRSQSVHTSLSVSAFGTTYDSSSPTPLPLR